MSVRHPADEARAPASPVDPLCLTCPVSGAHSMVRKTLQKKISERRAPGRPKHAFLIINIEEKYTER